MAAPGKGQVAALYDGQPRQADGRFDYGKQIGVPGKTTFDRKEGLKTEPMPRQWRTAKGNRAKMLLNTYQARGGGDLRHEGLDGVAVNRDSMAHSSSPNVSPDKAAILMSPKVLQAMFGAGHAKLEPVRKTKKGQPDKKKADWLECWHITGNVKVDGKLWRYDFTVAKKKDISELYDLKIQ